MAETNLKWCCQNSECKRKNLIDGSIVRMAAEKKKRLLMPCGTCGHVFQFTKIGTERGSDFCGCIPFQGVEKKLPSGQISSGTYEDYKGKYWSRNDFIEEYGVDPELYLRWVNARKPQYKVTCD
jgi:hypothetical protein